MENPSQGKVIGVIIPPPEIRAVVDKTAQFVARNGKSFEQRILSSGEGQTAKFNFMKAFDPYHAYYEMKIREFEEGVSTTDTVSKETSQAAAVAANTATEESKERSKQATTQAQPSSVSTSVKASITNPIAQLAKIKPTEAPPELEFCITHPSGLTALDVDIIKLTAQYTSINGREFLAMLALREQRNPQFDFLKPTHMLFSYFTSLVDSYAKITNPSEATKNKIANNLQFKMVMENSVNRWSWIREEEEKKKMESSVANEERLAFQAIDWFDFSIVETIDFPVDELFELPGLDNIALEEKKRDVLSNNNIALLTTRTTTTEVATATSGGGGSSYFKPSQQETLGDYEEVNESEVVTMDTNEDMSDLKVISDYQYSYNTNISSNTNSSTNASKAQMMLDPISGNLVPIDQMSEHMRVQLLDPKWRQQQKVFMEKQKETGYAEGSSIADSLKQFARKRGDIFGQAATGSGPNSAAAIAEQQAIDKKKEEIKSQVQWDGHYGSINSVQQIKYDLAAKAPSAFVPNPSSAATAPAIGPTLYHNLTSNSSNSNSSASSTSHIVSSNVSGATIQPILQPPPAVVLNTIVPPAVGMMNYMLPPPPSSVPLMPSSLLPPMPSYPLPVPATVVTAAMMAPPPSFPPHPSYLFPPPPPLSMNIMSVNEPLNKKAKLELSENALVPAEEFAARFCNGDITINIILPTDPSPQGVSWNLNGQTIQITISILETIKKLKEIVSSDYLSGMPLSKQQLKSNNPGLGFLKDINTLAELNINNNEYLELSVKSRGGKR